MKKNKSLAKFSALDINFLFNSSLNFIGKLSISTDSRTLKVNQIFLPLSGKNFDGHDFINSVLSENNKLIKGITTLSFCDKKKLNKVKKKYRDRLILVEDTIGAYHKLAAYYRNKVSPIVVAITGSSGKTTCKDLVSSVLSLKYKVHYTQGNFNNEIGIPKTVLDMPHDTEVLVVELAMRSPGEIKTLSKIVKPDIAVITNVGTSHIGRLKSHKAILKAKCEILEGLNRNGLVILPNSAEIINETKKRWDGKISSFDLDDATDVSFDNWKTTFFLRKNELCNEKYSVKALGKTHILNSLVAILIAKYLGLTKEDIQKGFLSFTTPQGRGNIEEISKDIYLIDESYNANPDSVKHSVSNMIDCWDSRYKKILVLGELAELGKFKKALLADLSKWLNSFDELNIITIGKKLKTLILGKNVENVCDINSAIRTLSRQLCQYSVVMVKGSRVAGLDRLVSVPLKRKIQKSAREKAC